MKLLKNKYSFVIFDWDGTLMDSTGRIVSSMQEAARIHQIDVPSDEKIKSSIGLSMQGVMDHVFPNMPAEMEPDFFKTYRDQYVEHNTTPAPFFPGSMELLHWLRAEKILIGVATGKARHGLKRAIDMTNSEGLFDFSICADEAKSKPHPEMIERLLDESQVKPEQALLLGDSIHDLKMAQNANIDSIAVTSGAGHYNELQQHNPVTILESVCHLKSWFQS
jgi:phosphoglycolate phosphatase